jgi:hypothetical protein
VPSWRWIKTSLSSVTNCVDIEGPTEARGFTI